MKTLAAIVASDQRMQRSVVSSSSAVWPHCVCKEDKAETTLLKDASATSFHSGSLKRARSALASTILPSSFLRSWLFGVSVSDSPTEAKASAFVADSSGETPESRCSHLVMKLEVGETPTSFKGSCSAMSQIHIISFTRSRISSCVILDTPSHSRESWASKVRSHRWRCSGSSRSQAGKLARPFPVWKLVR